MKSVLDSNIIIAAFAYLNMPSDQYLISCRMTDDGI